MKENILNIATVHQCNCCLGNKTLHPLVSVIDLSKADLQQRTLKFDFYTILLLEEETHDFMYGRRYYDYSNATVVFLTPGQSFRADEGMMFSRKGWLLAFHPDLIYHTSLGRHIKDYTFFSYHPMESLHLSLREKNRVIECFNNIGQELQHAIDCHSKTLISRYIELLLDYCSRFYERQFITRNEANKVILQKTERLLDEYISSGRLKNNVYPTDEYCAGILHLSPSYFSDLLKFETGKNLYEYFQLKRMETSKQMLSDKNYTVAMVAKQLGFSNVQYFSCLFKKITGMAPNEYRVGEN